MVGNLYLTEKEKEQGAATRIFFHDVITKGGLLRFITPRNPQEEKSFAGKECITVTIAYEKGMRKSKTEKETSEKKPATVLRKKLKK